MKESIVLRTEQDIEDMLAGFAFLGTGGGGPVEAGRQSLLDCLHKGLELKVTALEEIDDDGLYCCPFFMGSIAPKTQETLHEIERIGFDQRKYYLEEILMGAVKTLEDFTGKRMKGIYIAEPGGSNGGCCMAAAYKLGLQLVDGDPAGRAIPEATNGLHAIRNIVSLPAAYFDSWGNRNLTLETFNDHAMERIGKYLSQASFGEMGEAAYIMKGRDLKRNVVPDTISKSLRIGRAMRNGGDIVEAAAQAVEGVVVGRGVIKNFEPLDSGGYYWGTYEIEGEGKGAGERYRIWFKNENHVLWKGDTVICTSPHLISLIDLNENFPLNNSNLKNGIPVGIVISEAHEYYQTPEAIQAFSPRVLGCPIDYVPFRRDI